MKCQKKRQIATIILFLGLGLISTLPVHAAFGTHLNVTVTEQVFQETSFAENYTLTEWQKMCYSLGTINVSNPNNETVFDIYILFNNTAGLDGNFTHDAATKWGNQTSGTPGTDILIYIPELRQGNFSVFTYNISCMGINPPVNIDSSYTNLDHGFNAKVLSGYNWTVNQTVTNNNKINKTLTNVNITIMAANVTWNTSKFPFNLSLLNPVDDYTNVSGNGTSWKSWWWAPGGGTLAWHDNKSISYIVGAPNSVPFTASYMGIKERVEFQVDSILSGLHLIRINASAEVLPDFTKKIVQPSDNIENHNVTWEISPTVLAPVNITFNLNEVTLWVTQNMDPTNDTGSTSWGYLGYNYTSGGLPSSINLTTQWSGAAWRFNYTDGANATFPPPIVWMEPEWLIANINNQIMNYSRSYAGNDVYLKYIYVVHGYWLEVEKNVTSVGEDEYNVRIEVRNIGNGWTPEFERVTVYDFVPSEFVVWNMGPAPFACPTGSYCTNLSIGTAGDQFYGMSYRWDIPYKDGKNSSLGPSTGPNSTTGANYTWNVSYTVNGTGPYKVTDLYIVGLDPLKVDGAFSSPIITIISGIQSYTNEIIYISVIAFLIIVNITNLIMTNRIHSKINERLPPAPPPKVYPPN